MEILNNVVEKVKVYFELNNPKPVKARLTLEDGSKEDIILYDGLFLKGKSGYAPLFYVKDGVEIQIGIGNRIIKVPTGESAFWEVPPEFLGIAKKDISNVTVRIMDDDDIALLSKIYNYLIKIAPEFRSKFERHFILNDFDSLNVYPGIKYAVLNSVSVRNTRIDDKEVSIIELNDGRAIVQMGLGIYLLFDTFPTNLAIRVAMPVAKAVSEYSIVQVKTHYGDVPVEVWTPLGDVIGLMKRLKSGIIVISKKSGDFVAKLNANVYVSGSLARMEDVKKLERRLEFSHTSPIGDVRFYKNRWGDKIIVVFTNGEVSSRVVDNVEDYVEDIKYTATWFKGISEELRKVVTIKIPSAVSGFIGNVLKKDDVNRLGLDDL